MKFKEILTNFMGMRTLKTAISVFLCILVTRLLGIQYPFYSCIAAVISMQGSVSSSFHTGKNRMLGTFVGAVTGLVFALIAPANIFLIALGITIVISICSHLKWNKSVSISCIVFLAIMTNLDGKSPFVYSSGRLIETFIGIVISVAVNYAICPPKYLNRIILSSNTLVDTTILFCGNKFCHNIELNIGTISNEISHLKTHISNYKKDFIIKARELIEINTVLDIITMCNIILISINIINSLGDDLHINDANKKRLTKLYNCNLDNLSYENNDVNIVFNYHLNIIIDSINTLLKFEINKEQIGNVSER